GTKANLSSDLKTYVIEAIPATLRNTYGLDIDDSNFVSSIYHSDMAGFDKGVKGRLKEIDPISYEKERISFLAAKTERRDQHLQASLGHLARGRGKLIVLVIDNADQRTFALQQ